MHRFLHLLGSLWINRESGLGTQSVIQISIIFFLSCCDQPVTSCQKCATRAIACAWKQSKLTLRQPGKVFCYRDLFYSLPDVIAGFSKVAESVSVRQFGPFSIDPQKPWTAEGATSRDFSATGSSCAIVGGGPLRVGSRKGQPWKLHSVACPCCSWKPGS